MNKEELGKLYPIKVVKYNPEWINWFEAEKQTLLSILSNELTIKIEHFGSTAVPGLSAKPTIDILVEIPENSRELIKEKLIPHGYIHMEEQTNHLMFVKGYTPTGIAEKSYHIHMATKDQDDFWDRLYFRDYLKQNKSIVEKYESLKLELAEKFKHDREAYTEEKGDFIKKITDEAKEFVFDKISDQQENKFRGNIWI